jgi:hypothetical protein
MNQKAFPLKAAFMSSQREVVPCYRRAVQPGRGQVTQRVTRLLPISELSGEVNKNGISLLPTPFRLLREIAVTAILARAFYKVNLGVDCE